jgi:flagellar biosynthesis/type III secretory pathway protein FliH
VRVKREGRKEGRKEGREEGRMGGREKKMKKKIMRRRRRRRKRSSARGRRVFKTEEVSGLKKEARWCEHLMRASAADNQGGKLAGPSA